MSAFPFGAADAQSADRWFAALSERLEELLGTFGAQAILSRALNDAQRHWPPLALLKPRQGGFDLSLLYSTYPAARGGGCSPEGAAALQGLVDSLRILLECLLGRRLASELMCPGDSKEGSSDEQEGQGPFLGCA